MRTPLTLSRMIAVACAVLVAASCGGTAASGAAPTPSGAAASPAGEPTLLWPAPSDPLERTVEAGLEPAPKEFTINHVHAHLDVFIDGEEILVPAGIGINIEDPEVTYFEDVGSYGGIEMCDQPCISPLHTHDAIGNPPYRVVGPGAAHPRPVLRRVGRRAQRDLRRGALRADADRRVHRR